MKTPPPYWKVKASPIVREYFEAKELIRGDWKYYSNGKGGLYATNIPEAVDLPTLTQAQFKKHFYDKWKAGQAGVNLADFFTIQEAAQQMGLTVKDLNAMTNESKIPFTKIKGRLYFHRNDVNSFPRFITTANVHERIKPNSIEVPKRPRPDSKRVTLAKHNRITAELQRQCEQLGSELAEAKNDRRIAQETIDSLMNLIDDYKEDEADLQARVETLEAHRDQVIIDLTDRNSALIQEVNRKDYMMNEKQKFNTALEDKLKAANEAIVNAKADAEKRDKAHTAELNYLLDSRNMWQAFAWVLGFASALLGIAQLIGG